MSGTTRVSKPAEAKTGVHPLGDGRWAYFVDGLVRFVTVGEEECRERARAAGYVA